MAVSDLIGSSAKFRALLDNVHMVAPVDSPVLIQGETGTGKEVIARAIHEGSPRRKNRFVALNCAAIPSSLIESELFGYEKGAFTGAVAQTVGRFQVADRGTLLLDEIGARHSRIGLQKIINGFAFRPEVAKKVVRVTREDHRLLHDQFVDGGWPDNSSDLRPHSGKRLASSKV